MLNKNILDVKKVKGQSDASLQTGTYICATKNFDIGLGQEGTLSKIF